MDSERTKKTSQPIESMPSEKVSISDKGSNLDLSPTKVNQVRFQSDNENEFFLSQDHIQKVPLKIPASGTSKNLMSGIQKKPFNETVKSPNSVWSSNRRIDQLIANGEMSAEISSSMKDTHFHKTNNFGDFHEGSIHTQLRPDQESRKNVDNRSLVISQKDSQIQSPKKGYSHKNDSPDLAQQVSLKSHISTPNKDSPRKPQTKFQAKVSSHAVTQRAPISNTATSIASVQQSGQFIKIQTNETARGSQLRLDKSQGANMSVQASQTQQFQEINGIVSETAEAFEEIADENSSVSIILPYSNFLPQPKQSQLQIAKKNLNDQIKFKKQVDLLQSRSFLAQPNQGISGSQPGANKYSKKMRAKYRKKAQQSYISQISQLLATQNMSSKKFSPTRLSAGVVIIPNENKMHDLSDVDELSTKQISQAENKKSTIQLQTQHSSPKRDTATSPCLPDTQRKDMAKNNDYQERMKQYQESMNLGATQKNVNQDDANRFIIGRKSIQTDMPISTAQVTASDNASPKPTVKASMLNQDLKSHMSKDVEVQVASNFAERHGGDDGLYDSDHYNNNLQRLNHPLMEEYEKKIHDHKNDYHQIREEIVKKMMQSNKSKIVVLPKNHHNKTMAQDLNKLSNAINFVTEMQIQNSLQQIQNQDEKIEIASDATQQSQVSNQQQIIIKTKNKTDRTNLEFPSFQASALVTSSKMNSKDIVSLMDEHKYANISDAENENIDSDKYYKSSQKTQTPITSGVPGKNLKLNNVYQNKKESQMRSDSDGGQTLYQDVSQHEGTPNQMKITGKFMSNQKLSKFANNVSRQSTLKNLIPSVSQAQNQKQEQNLTKEQTTSKTQLERHLKMNQDDLQNTSTPKLQASNTPPPQPSILNAMYDNNRQTAFSKELSQEQQNHQNPTQIKKQPQQQDSIKDNLQFMIGQSSSTTTNAFPKISQRYKTGENSEEIVQTNERSAVSPQTLLSKQPSYSKILMDNSNENKNINSVRRVSINNPKQININSKIAQRQKINANLSSNIFVMDNQKDSIQRINDENSSLNGSNTNQNGLRISLPALGSELMNYSQMIDTSKNSNNSFQGIKRVQMQNARNSSMIQISKTNLDVAQMLLSTSSKAAQSQSRKVVMDLSALELDNISGQRRSMKQELVRLKEIQRLKELKEMQIKSQNNMQKLLYRELAKAHNPAMNFKHSQRPGQFKTKKMMTEIENNKSALLLDVIKQKNQRMQIKVFKGRDLSKLDTNRQFFGSLKDIESSRTNERSPNQNRNSSMAQLEQQSAILKSIRKSSIQLTESNMTSSDQKKNEQEMQYIINNMTERDVLKIQNDNFDTPWQPHQKSNKIQNQYQMIMLSSKSDNYQESSTPGEKQFVSFSKGNSKVTRRSDQDPNLLQFKKRQSVDQAMMNDEDSIETNNSKSRVRECKSPLLLVTRNETQPLMNKSSKTSQLGEINSRQMSMGGNEGIENNFSTNTSKDRLILKSQIRSNRSNQNDTQIRSKENEIRLESNTIIQRSSQAGSKEMSVEISSPKHFQSNYDEISNLKNIVVKKNNGFKTNIGTTVNNTFHKIQEMDNTRNSSGSQTEAHRQSQIVKIFESQSPKMKGIVGLHSQDTVEFKQEQSAENMKEQNFSDQRKVQNESPGLTHKSVISGVKIYRKSSQRWKKSGQQSQISPSDKEIMSSFQRSQIDPIMRKSDLQQKINATQISLSPISLRSPSHSHLKKGVYDHEGIVGERVINGAYQKPTMNQIFPQQQLNQEFMLPKHLSQISFALQQKNNAGHHSTNRDLSPERKNTALNIIQESQLGDTLKITPRLDDSIMSQQELSTIQLKKKVRNQKVRFSVKSYDAGAHHSLPSEVNFSNVFENLICQPLNIKKLNELRKISKSQNRELMSIWKKNLEDQQQKLALNLINVNDQEPGIDQNIQTTNRGVSQSPIHSIQEERIPFEQKIQRGWNEQGQVMQIIHQPEMSQIKSQAQRNQQDNALKKAQTANFKANQQYAITPIEEFNSTDKNGTLEIRSPNENSKSTVAPFVVNQPTSISSISNEQKSHQQNNPIDIVQVNSNLMAFSNLHVDTSMNQSPKYSPKAPKEAARKEPSPGKKREKKVQVQRQDKLISIQNIAQSVIQQEQQLSNQESQSRMMATEQQYHDIIRKAEESNKWLFPQEMLSQRGEKHLMLGAYQGSSQKLTKASPRNKQFIDHGTQMSIIDQNFASLNDYSQLEEFNQEHGVLYQGNGQSNQGSSVNTNRKLFSYQKDTDACNSTKKGDLFAISQTHVA